MKKILRKIILKHKCSSEAYLNYLREKGTIIGEGTIVFEPTKTFIDETRPFLIEIGKNVQITRGVTILTHGYDWSVLKGCYGEVLGSAGKVKIGNNVFIGQNAMILKGVTIGNNVIIGANSLVNKDLKDNAIYAGNPARYIMSIEEYFAKRKRAQLFEAKCIYDNYVSVYKKEPNQEIFSEFFWLFYPRNEKLIPQFEKQMKNVGNYEYSIEKFINTKPMFTNYEEFLDALKKM